MHHATTDPGAPIMGNVASTPAPVVAFEHLGMSQGEAVARGTQQQQAELAGNHKSENCTGRQKLRMQMGRSPSEPKRAVPLSVVKAAPAMTVLPAVTRTPA